MSIKIKLSIYITEKRRKERELMETIQEGNFEDIEKEVTPRAFQNCESSLLRMGMKVCEVVMITRCSYYDY